MEVGGGEIFTKITIAIRIERSKHFAVFCITDIDASVWSVECAIARLAGWSDAVEGVATVFGANE